VEQKRELGELSFLKSLRKWRVNPFGRKLPKGFLDGKKRFSGSQPSGWLLSARQRRELINYLVNDSVSEMAFSWLASPSSWFGQPSVVPCLEERLTLVSVRR
jgi:hypothetical protein